MKLIAKGFLLLVAVLVLLIAWTLFNGVRVSEDSYAGLPRSAAMELRPWSPGWFHVIDPPGFVLGYSELLRNPLWVAYRLEEPGTGKIPPRPRHFTEESRSLFRVSPDDYRRSGYDRGHLAPNYAMARYEGRAAQLASFRMSNITPQRPALNQKFWQRLEEVETDIYAAEPGYLWVVTGPVFAPDYQRMPSGVALPQAFFRIWLRELRPGEPEVLAFMVPQTVSGYESLDRFIVSVDEIEAATGLDFFHALPDALENRLEAERGDRGWGLKKHATKPPRY